ncbi:MAG: hypothetical protein ACYTDW_15965 [Planctomycetota bacterium]|jgi:hypothetical protein
MTTVSIKWLVIVFLFALFVLAAIAAGVVGLVVCLTRKKKHTSDEKKTEGS